MTIINSIHADKLYPALNTIAELLESPALTSLWAKNHITKSHDNKTLQIAEEIRQIKKHPLTRPDLFRFMIELVNCEKNALGVPKIKEDLDTKLLRKQITILAEILSLLSKDMILPPRSALPKEQKQVLHMIEVKTGQIPFRPLRTMLNVLKASAKHIAEDAKEHPLAFTGLLAASLGTLAFMNHRMGTSATIYIDPKVTAITNLSLDTIGNPNSVIEIDSSMLKLDLQPSCHDHLNQLLGETGAEIVKNTLEMANLFPAHCSRLKTLAEDAQKNLNSSYEIINSRLDLFIKEPTTDLASKLLPDTPFLAAFNQAAHNTAELVYALNTLENIVVHTIIFASSIATTIKLGTLESEEGRELRQNIVDTLYKIASQSPLNILFGIGSATYAYAINGSINPNVIWCGLAGTLTGHLTHSLSRKFKAKEFIKETNIGVIKQQALVAKSEGILNEKISSNIPSNHKKSWQYYTRKPIFIGTTAVILTSLDVATTAGQISGNIAGTLCVAVPFLLYNVPEDAALHLIFGIAGGLVGATCAALIKAKRAINKPEHKPNNSTKEQTINANDLD